jgi:cysteine desulfurase
MRIYFDHAASTNMLPEAVSAMLPYLTSAMGNPSATHSEGRAAKAAIEQSRKTIAELIHCRPNEIIYTSGGTEANNMAIVGAVRDLGVRRIITTSIEHACVQNTISALQKQYGTDLIVEYIALNRSGLVEIEDLSRLLALSTTLPTLVSVIHAHNELGGINDLAAIGQVCQQYGAYLHSDMVQTIGHLDINLSAMPYLHFASASAHKFGGAKGCGFLYLHRHAAIGALIEGGGQERKLRGGTENVAGIVSMSAALQMSAACGSANAVYLSDLRAYFISQLAAKLPDIRFNIASDVKYLYSILSIGLPYNKPLQTLLFQLDLGGIAASAGAACSSGAVQASAVMRFLDLPQPYKSLRFSFASSNTKTEVDTAVALLVKLATS